MILVAIRTILHALLQNRSGMPSSFIKLTNSLKYFIDPWQAFFVKLYYIHLIRERVDSKGKMRFSLYVLSLKMAFLDLPDVHKLHTPHTIT